MPPKVQLATKQELEALRALLQANGFTPGVSDLSSGSAGLKSMSVLTSGTAATYTVPAGIHRLKVRVQGPGGGGGGGDGGTTDAGFGAGGGEGAYAEKIHNSVTPGQSFTYTVPAGANGGAAGNNAGSNASDTLWDEAGSVVTAGGGLGGASMAAGTTVSGAVGGLGGTATGGDLNIPGQAGQSSRRFSGTTGFPGMGGGSRFGSAAPFVVNADANAGVGFGSGGTGAAAASNATDRAGAAGRPGVIIVEEYE